MSLSPAAREGWNGVRDQLPILVGVAPFGVIYGALAVQSGLPAPASQAMSSIVFAGSSQFIAVQLLGAGASALVIFAVIFVVNLRHALYSLSIAEHLQPLGAGWKWLLAYLLTDEAYAVGITRFRKPDASPHKHWYFLGSGLALWTCWQLATALGVWFGGRVTGGLSLSIALPLTFIALVVPGLRDRPSLAAALSAGAVSLLAAPLPYKTGLLLAALVGVAAGGLAEWLTQRRSG